MRLQYQGETPAVLADHSFAENDVIGVELGDEFIPWDAEGGLIAGQSPTLLPGTIVHFRDDAEHRASVLLVPVDEDEVEEVESEPEEQPTPEKKPAPRRRTSRKEQEK